MKNLKPLDILFMGSDAFSVGVLSQLLRSKDVYNSISVVTPAIKAYGRRRNQEYVPELQKFALSKNLPHYSVPDQGIAKFIPPETFLTPSPTSLLVTASFGSILPEGLLSVFDNDRKLNVHPSLLPKYRGAAPIQHALMNGDKKMGVSILGMSLKGTDRGDIWEQKEILIPDAATYHSLVPTLAEEGAVQLVKTLRKMITGTATSSPQDPSLATRANKITRETAHINFETQSAVEIERLYRAIGHQLNLSTHLPPHGSAHPAPRPINLYSISLPPSSYLPIHPPPPGTAFFHPRINAISVQCGGEGGGMVLFESAQIGGKPRAVTATELWYGFRDAGLVGLMESVQFGKGKEGEGEMRRSVKEREEGVGRRGGWD